MILDKFQPRLEPMGTKTWAAGAEFSFELSKLSSSPINGRRNHLVGFLLEMAAAPTYTTAPTQQGMDKGMLADLEFYDGDSVRTKCDGNGLRDIERVESGGLRQPDVLTSGASTNVRYWRRFLPIGPANAANPLDHAMLIARLKTGYLRGKHGVLTDFSADCTAMTATLKAWAVEVQLDYVNLPPFWERRQIDSVSSGQQLKQQALYGWLLLLKSTARAAFSVGDIATISARGGQGDLIPAVDTSALTAAFNACWNRGGIHSVIGDSRDATYDVGNRKVNTGTPTALAVQLADFQIALFGGPDQEIGKLFAYVPEDLTVEWTGSASGIPLMFGRYKPTSDDDFAQEAAKAATAGGFGQSGRMEVPLMPGGNAPLWMAKFLPRRIRFN